MFTLKGRTASISTNEEEKQVFNERLQAIQEKKGIVFTSFKDVFTHLQTMVLQDPEPQLAQGEVAVEKETLDKLAVNSQKLAQILSTLENYPKTDGLQDLEGVDLVLKIIENSLQTPQKLEPEQIEVERPLQEHEILLQLSDKRYPKEKKLQLLEIIQKNRSKKLKTSEEMGEMIENMIFNDNIVFNLGGEFYTGINKIK